LWASGLAQAIGILEQLAGHPFRLDETVGDLLGEDIPDGNEQFARNGDNSLVTAQAGFQASQFCFPVRMGISSTTTGSESHNTSRLALTQRTRGPRSRSLDQRSVPQNALGRNP